LELSSQLTIEELSAVMAFACCGRIFLSRSGGRKALSTSRAYLESLLEYGRTVLTEKEPLQKKALTHEARKLFVGGNLRIRGSAAATAPESWARNELPAVLDPSEMPKPKEAEGSAILFYLHSLAHVELNAINLCWDTMVRFSNVEMPEEFYDELLRVADDESRHYGWLHTRLSDLGSEYGAYPVHDLIWQAARSTSSDLAERLAIGQLVQEARGLDAAPRVADRLRSWKDKESAKIVEQIGVEEVDHVKMGVKWYLHLCKRDAIVDPISNFHKIALKHANYGALSPPFNEKRRTMAGLTPEWYQPVSAIVVEILNQRNLERRRARQAAN